MPRELIATAPRTPELRTYEEPPLGPDEGASAEHVFHRQARHPSCGAYRADTRWTPRSRSTPS